MSSNSKYYIEGGILLKAGGRAIPLLSWQHFTMQSNREASYVCNWMLRC